jgi:hypothetical protein
MKELAIEVKYHKNQNHTIHIGNCEWLEFKSKRFVRDYIVRYKRMLKDNIGVVETLQTKVYQLYRENYFQLSNKTNRDIRRMFIDYLIEFDMIFKRYSKDNHNAFFLKKIDLCFSIIYSVLDLLKTHAQKHKNYLLNNQVGFLYKMIDTQEKCYEKEKRDLTLEESQKQGKLVFMEAEKSKNSQSL